MHARFIPCTIHMNIHEQKSMRLFVVCTAKRYRCRRPETAPQRFYFFGHAAVETGLDCLPDQSVTVCVGILHAGMETPWTQRYRNKLLNCRA